MTTEYTMEKKFQIWNDKTGERIDVGRDRDGLNLIEIRQVDSMDSAHGTITLDVQQAKLVVSALQQVIEDLDSL